MHHSANLQSTHRHNILKHRLSSQAISLIWLGVIVAILASVILFSNLNAFELLGGFTASLVRTSIAYLIALAIALLIALLITTNQTVENIFLPIFDVLQSFPSFALFPVLVVALRNSPETVIITVLTITMIWPILFTIIGGVKNRREDLEEAAVVFGATGIKRLFYYTFPGLMPSIITGSIVGWGEGWEFIIGAELLVKTNVGIGTYLGSLGETGQNLLLAFGIFILMLLLFAINKSLWLPLLHRATRYETEN